MVFQLNSARGRYSVNTNIKVPFCAADSGVGNPSTPQFVIVQFVDLMGKGGKKKKKLATAE
jgi:hypothetical protein